MKRLFILIAVAIATFLIMYLGIILDVFDFQFNKISNAIIIIATVALIFASGVFSMLFYYRKKDKKIDWLSNRLEQWSNLSVHVNKAGDEVFSELPIGIIIYDEQEEVKWVNRFAKVIFNGDLLDKTLSEVNTDLQVLLKSNDDTFTFSVGQNSYDVIHKKDHRLFYLFDVSQRESVTRKYNQRIPALGIVNLDNLDNETKAFDMQERINLRGQYLGEISDWATKYNGYLKSYDDGSLLIICEHASLQQMIDEKFDILTKIRNISQSHGIRVTCSIGFACHETNFEELGTLAQTSFDLAEKRGGDQVVVNIQHKKIQYFGASLNAVEKNTYLHARAKTLELKDLVESSRNIYIMGHNNTDADSLGAMIGMLRICLTSTKKASIVLDPKKIDSTSMKIYEEILLSNDSVKNNIISFEQADVDENSLLIIVDTQSKRLVMNPDFLDKFKKYAVVDHHRADDQTFESPTFAYIEPYASSTVELVSEMLMFYNPKATVPLSPLDATIMLTGIVVDTNNFTFRCGSRAFEAASRLRERGADMIMVRKILRNDYDIQMKLNKYITMAKVLLDQFAVVVVEDEILEDRTLLAQISENLLNIDGVDAAFTISKTNDDTISISARSYEHVNVQIIMEELGGGGHLNSAATQIKNSTLKEVKQSLAIILKRDYEIGDQTMKVILLEDIKGRGLRNDIIDVATGYGNYLLTNKKGILATDETLKVLQSALDLEKNRLEDELKMMNKIKSELETKVVNVYIKFGADGRAFGSVTTKQICEELESQYGIQVDKRKVVLPLEINSIGIFSATINLHKDVTAQLEINVLEK
ncbi:MAG: 50S ribosomal protein L9 [bacterium]